MHVEIKCAIVLGESGSVLKRSLNVQSSGINDSISYLCVEYIINVFGGLFLSCYHENTTEVSLGWGGGEDNCPPKFRQNSGNCVFNL